MRVGCMGLSTMRVALRMQHDCKPDYLLGCPHHLLQSCSLSGAVPKPDRDAAPREALYSPSMQCGEDVGWQTVFQPLLVHQGIKCSTV